MSKTFWAIIAIIILIIGGAVVISNNRKASAPTVSATNHIEGSASSGVKLVEYGDFQCPACESYHAVTEQVVDKYKDQIQFQFRNFPLTSIHPNAFAASRAAEAASLQGKFWEMYRTLYDPSNYYVWAYNAQGQTVTSGDQTNNFNTYAKNLGLNVDKFKSDFSSSAVNDTIQADIAAGKALDITGTPSYFLDGKKVINPPTTLDDWSKLIDAAIANKKNS